MRISDWSSDVCSSDLMMLIGQRRRHATSRSAWLAVIAGLVVARLAYVALNWAAFSGDWIAMLAFWQGGFELWPGAIAAGLVLLLTLPDNRTLARAGRIGGLHVRPQRDAGADPPAGAAARSEEHTSELQSLMRISYAVFCLKKK